MNHNNRLDQILKKLKQNNCKLFPPIPLEELKLIEAKYGFVLPNEYRDFITCLGNGATLPPISNDCIELNAFSDYRTLSYASIPFPLTESQEWCSAPDFSPDDPDCLTQFNASQRNGQIILMNDSCDGGLCWILIVTGQRRGEIWLKDEEGYLRLPECSFLDWLELYLQKKLVPFVNDLFWKQRKPPKDTQPFLAIKELMKAKRNRDIQWNPVASLDDIHSFELRHNIVLPNEYKQFISEIADGCTNFVAQNSHGKGGVFFSLKQLDSLINLDKPFYYTENTNELYQELTSVFGKYNSKTPVWTSKFAAFPRENPLSKVWVSPDYSVLHGVLPFAIYNDDNDCLNTQVCLILNGPLKGQVWLARKHRLYPGENDSTFFSWVTEMLKGCAI